MICTSEATGGLYETTINIKMLKELTLCKYFFFGVDYIFHTELFFGVGKYLRVAYFFLIDFFFIDNQNFVCSFV